jgi:ketosteroid isomerase-like protein
VRAVTRNICAMSIEENLAAVRRYADAWKAGDLAGIFACYHEDFTLHYGGANPLSGVHAGKAAALQVLAEVSRRTNRKLEEIVDVGAGDGALVELIAPRASDLVLVDRSIEPRHGHIVIAAVNGEPLCKRLQRVAGQVLLRSENPRYAPRYIMEGDDFMIWGVVTFSVRSHDPAA